MLILKEEWQGNPKILKAVYLAGTPQVKHFWFELLSSSANAGTDGIIEPYRLPSVAQSCGIDPETADQFLKALLDSNVKPTGAPLFHDAASLRKCTACREALKEQGHKPGPDDVVAHDFLVHNPANKDKTPMGRLRVKRKNWLNRNGKTLKLEAYTRDRGLCRYCGCRPVEGADGPESLQFDHMDPNPTLPNNGNFLENLATGCKACNTRKGQRTPEEAGMHLLAAGTTRQDVLDGRATYVTTLAEVAPTPRPAPPAPGPDADVPSRVGEGSGSDPGRLGGRSHADQGRIISPPSSSPKSKGSGSSRRGSKGGSRPESLPP